MAQTQGLGAFAVSPVPREHVTKLESINMGNCPEMTTNHHAKILPQLSILE